MKSNQRASESEIRISRSQHCEIGPRYFSLFAHIDGGCRRGINSRRVAMVRQKSYLARLRLVESRGSLDFDVAVAWTASRSGVRGEFGEFHRREFSASGC